MEIFTKMSKTIQFSIFLTVFVVVGVHAALDLEPDLEWDPCKIDVLGQIYKTGGRVITSENYNFTPPACKVVNITQSGQCEYFICLSTLPISKQEIGYFRITTNWKSDSGVCPRRPRLPSYVQVLDLTFDQREDITASIFDDVTDLKFIRSLVLLSRKIASISEDVIGNLSSLECLNLDFYEEPEGYPVLRTFLLYVPTLKRLSVRQHHFTAQLIKVLPTIPDQFNLRSLWLSGNKYDSRTPLRFYLSIRGLDLSKSSFVVKPVIVSTTLESLDLSDSSLKSLPQFCFIDQQYLPQLSRLDVSNNQITQIPLSELRCKTKLTFLDLRRNKLTSFDSYVFYFFAPLLEILHLGDQSVDDRFRLESSERSEESPYPLRELYLENNNVRFDKEVGEWAFLRRTPNLQKLFLDGCNLRVMPELTFLLTFGHLSQLRTLSLPKTKLPFVSAEAFSGSVFPNMTELMLGDNAITRIPDGCFDSLTQLVQLDLSGNKITTVSSLTFSPSLRVRLQAFDLSQNPFTCSCDLMWFWNWFRSDHRLFNTTADEYECHNFQHKIPLSDFIVNEQSCLLSREANSMIIFCCSVIITTFTIFTLLFRYRWHLRLVLYEAFRGRDDVRRRRLEQGNFDHDVFVSYASEDLNWVRRHLMPQLEDHLHLRLCIHDRQFIPGKNIVDNIADCVEKSKKILMVFTKNFLRSQWCQFELAFCLSHVMEHEDALIILCLDDVVSCEMTSTMMAVLRTTTYIQWENQADAVRSFWGRLKLALNEVIPTEENAV